MHTHTHTHAHTHTHTPTHTHPHPPTHTHTPTHTQDYKAELTAGEELLAQLKAQTDAERSDLELIKDKDRLLKELTNKTREMELRAKALEVSLSLSLSLYICNGGICALLINSPPLLLLLLAPSHASRQGTRG